MERAIADEVRDVKKTPGTKLSGLFTATMARIRAAPPRAARLPACLPLPSLVARASQRATARQRALFSRSSGGRGR